MSAIIETVVYAGLTVQDEVEKIFNDHNFTLDTVDIRRDYICYCTKELIWDEFNSICIALKELAKEKPEDVAITLVCNEYGTPSKEYTNIPSFEKKYDVHLKEKLVVEMWDLRR